MNIAVIGTWYVWLTHGTCLAELWHTVTCFDIDEDKISLLHQWIIPFFEPGLQELVSKNSRNWLLTFSSKLESLDAIDLVFIAVWTPQQANWKANLQYIESVSKTIGQVIHSSTVIVVKSTVPVGTTQKIKSWIMHELEKRSVDISFDVLANPEFLREWSAVNDFFRSDRIVIWTDNQHSNAVVSLKALYQPIKTTVLVTDLSSAELIKYSSNAFLALQISFINSIAQLCEKVWWDVTQVTQWLQLDTRIGKHSFLHAWAWFWWSCFPKDVMEFAATFREHGLANWLLDATTHINETQKQSVCTKIHAYIPELTNKTIAIWGTAFKPNTDDMRYASSLVVIDYLISQWATIQIYDPEAMETCTLLYPHLVYCDDPYICVKDADCLVLLTERDIFRHIDWAIVQQNMHQHYLIDGRNIYDPNKMRDLWFTYTWIWR